MQFSENNLKSGDDGIEETLLPIPNRKVKLYSADGTARETVWESRTLPGKNGSIAQLVEQRIEDPRVVGSIPTRATIYGGIAQLGEHLPCTQGVKSSNLFISTNFKDVLRNIFFCIFIHKKINICG